MRKFFINSDDFFYIINSQMKGVKSIKQISTGWTNFVFEVKAMGGKYIFRFPRNDFFAAQLEKECSFLASFDHKLLPAKVPKIKLCYFKGRPYSRHAAIKGKPIEKCNLSKRKTERLAKDMLNFLDALSKISTKVKLPTTSQFLRELSLVSGGEYDLSKHAALEIEEQKGLVLSHGDFNPGNILVRRGKMYGVLDFAFVSYSTPLDDVARIVGRRGSLAKFILPQLQLRGETSDAETRIEKLCEVWRYVEQKYIEYIKREHRDIILPEN